MHCEIKKILSVNVKSINENQVKAGNGCFNQSVRSTISAAALFDKKCTEPIFLNNK